MAATKTDENAGGDIHIDGLRRHAEDREIGAQNLAKRLCRGKGEGIPRRPPIRVMTSDSPKIIPAIRQPPKPRVLKMAYSPIRSRAVMAMVLAATAMMMTITTKETSWMAMMIASVMEMKASRKAFSVSVRVSAREFLKVLSIARATSAARFGSVTPTMYHPPGRPGAALSFSSSRSDSPSGRRRRVSSVLSSLPW